MNSNGWNKRMRISTNRLGEVSATYNILHDRCAIFYNYIDFFLGLSSGITTVVIGVLITVPNYTPCDRATGYEQNVYTSLLFTSAILQFLKQYLGLGKESLKHTEYAKKYRILSNNIMNQMLVYKDGKNSAQDYIIDMATQINNNISSSPSINPFISWYYNRHKISQLETISIQSNDNNDNNDYSDNFYSIEMKDI